MKHVYKNIIQKQHQAGFTLIEISLVLMIITTVITGIIIFMQNANRELELRNDAKKLNVITDAAKNFITLQRNRAANTSNTFTLLPGANDGNLVTKEVALKNWQVYVPDGTTIDLGQRADEKYSVRLFARDFRTVPASPTSVNDPQAFLIFTSNATPYNALDGEKVSIFSEALVKYITPDEVASQIIRGPNNTWNITIPSTVRLRSGDLVVPIFLSTLLEKSDSNSGLEAFRGKEWRQLADPTYWVPKRVCSGGWFIWCWGWSTIQVPVSFPPSGYKPSYPMIASTMPRVPSGLLSGHLGFHGLPGLSIALVNFAHQAVHEATINVGRDKGFHTSAIVIGFDPQNGPDRGSMLRKPGVTYTNDTGMPLMISITANHEDSMTKSHCSNIFQCAILEIQYLTGRRDESTLRLVVDGVAIATESIIDSSGSMVTPIEAIIPPNSTYRVETNSYARMVSWAELR